MLPVEGCGLFSWRLRCSHALQIGSCCTMANQAHESCRCLPLCINHHVTRRTSHVTRHTSHVTWPTSPPTHLTHRLQIWHRAEPDSPVHGFKIAATIRAPAQALLALVSEIDLYTCLFPFLSKSLEVQRLGRARRVANVVLKGKRPPPAAPNPPPKSAL